MVDKVLHTITETANETETARDRMSKAVRNWMVKLDDYPGWREWKHSSIAHTLHFDDEFMSPKEMADAFEFSEKVKTEHAVVTRYLALYDTVNSLRDVEWYFRRYPFAGTRVTRYSHLTHCCELYFGRFYQFKERLKKLFDAVKAAAPNRKLEVGNFIEVFEETFEREIRARNGVHHHERFDEVAISRVFLIESLAISSPGQAQAKELLSHYRKAVNEWAARTRRQVDGMDTFIEAVAAALLKVCPFLDETNHDSEASPGGP